MLGAQDFCGYYDWTFAHLRGRFGQKAVIDLWADAVGGDAQSHYAAMGKQSGMRGLFEAWRHTGEDEQCDWTFTLDEARNVLRWDMRKCPSKGFLLEHDRQSDEDYCDHCIGWEQPMLDRLGMEMAAHEHNHCGQCWGEIRVKGRPYETLKLDVDIRSDPRWAAGHLDRFSDGVRVSDDSVEAIRKWAGRFDKLVIFGVEEPGARDAVLISAVDYVTSDVSGSCAVLFESPPSPAVLDAVSNRLSNLRSELPLLLYPYFPKSVDVHFIDHGLSRPVPILPLLIRTQLYEHQPHVDAPPTNVLLAMLIDAIRHVGAVR